MSNTQEIEHLVETHSNPLMAGDSHGRATCLPGALEPKTPHHPLQLRHPPKNSEGLQIGWGLMVDEAFWALVSPETTTFLQVGSNTKLKHIQALPASIQCPSWGRKPQRWNDRQSGTQHLVGIFTNKESADEVEVPELTFKLHNNVYRRRNTKHKPIDDADLVL